MCVSTDYFIIPGYRLHSTKYLISVFDANGDLIPIDRTNVVRIKIGKNNELPVIDLNNTVQSPNGSFITNTNPIRMRLHQHDMVFSPGIYDVELLVLNDINAEVVTHVATGIFTMFMSQLAGLPM